MTFSTSTQYFVSTVSYYKQKYYPKTSSVLMMHALVILQKKKKKLGIYKQARKEALMKTDI